MTAIKRMPLPRTPPLNKPLRSPLMVLLKQPLCSNLAVTNCLG